MAGGKHVGLFGGSFDPPHLGHAALVQAGLEMGLEEVWVMPAVPVHRELSGCADAQTRLDWLKKMFADWPRVQVVDWELKQGRPTPAVETLRWFANQQPGHVPWLMLGADAWAGLESWREYPAHRDLCNVAVFARQGFSDVPAHAGWQAVRPENWQPIKQAGHYCFVAAALPDISATVLRADARQGLSLAGRVADVVCNEIEETYS